MASERRYTPRAPNQHNQGEAHLDALALLRLADGELVAPAARAHAGACAECGALLHAFRREGEILAGALALDAADLALLHQAALPAHVAGHAPAARRGAPAERESLGSLLAMVLAAGAGYVLWTFFSPLLLAALEVARWAGATALVAGVLAGWLVSATQWAWSASLAAGELPLIDSPVLPMLALALLLWLVAAVLPAPSAARRRFVIPGVSGV